MLIKYVPTSILRDAGQFRKQFYKLIYFHQFNLTWSGQFRELFPKLMYNFHLTRARNLILLQCKPINIVSQIRKQTTKEYNLLCLLIFMPTSACLLKHLELHFLSA